MPRRSASSSIVMPRSAPSVACATCHPAFSAPTRLAAGIRTSLRNISQKCESPIALRIGRTSTPGRRHVQQEVRNAFALGGFGVGAGQQQAPVGVHAAAGPQLLAVDDVAVAVPARRGAQARQIGSGLRFGEALHPDLAVEDRGQMPAALLVGARDQQCRRGVMDADERQHQPRRIVGGQLLIQHDLLGDRHAAAPLARPVRHGVARGVQLGEPRTSGIATNSSSPTPVWAGAPIGGDVRLAPGPHAAARNSSRSASRAISRFVYNPVSPRAYRRGGSAWSRVADNPSGSRRSGWLYRDNHDSVVSSQNPTAPCS